MVKRDGHSDRAATETVSRLQRGILRLALAYHGQNTDLDKKLKELGGLVRSGHRESGLQQLIDEIVDTIVALDLNPETSGQGPAGSPDGAELLSHFFTHLALPAPLLNDIERVRKRLANKADVGELLAQIEHAATAISAELARSSAVGNPLEPIRHYLLDLIERIPVSRQLAGDATAIRRSLEAVEQTVEFRPCLTAIAELVNKLREELQAELERLSDFLRSTARRLQEFEQAMTRSRELYADCAADALQLSDTVGDDIKDLRQDVSVSIDLDHIKSLIDTKLDSIDNGLNSFVALQRRRATEAGDVIDRMTHRLKDLEQQAAHLRDDLEVQHARVLIDPLTGILNRTGYLETAGKHFARWKRYGGALSLGVIDLDLFKAINDRYGHSAGDKVLATVALKLKEVIRESDILCRYGGEEFVLLLPETTAEDAAVLLDKLRTHIEQCPFRHKETRVRVTMSCGVANFHGNDSVDAVFERADQAMYRAKENGRNRVCMNSQPPSPKAAQSL